jgi:hypothetical protein
MNPSYETRQSAVLGEHYTDKVLEGSGKNCVPPARCAERCTGMNPRFNNTLRPPMYGKEEDRLLLKKGYGNNYEGKYIPEMPILTDKYGRRLLVDDFPNSQESVAHSNTLYASLEQERHSLSHQPRMVPKFKNFKNNHILNQSHENHPANKQEREEIKVDIKEGNTDIKVNINETHDHKHHEHSHHQHEHKQHEHKQHEHKQHEHKQHEHDHKQHEHEHKHHQHESPYNYHKHHQHYENRGHKDYRKCNPYCDYIPKEKYEIESVQTYQVPNHDIKKYERLQEYTLKHESVLPELKNHTPIELLDDTLVFNNKFFETPENKIFFSEIQPEMYQYQVDPEPINSLLGIAYASQNVPQFRDMVNKDGKLLPIYTEVNKDLAWNVGYPQREVNAPSWSATGDTNSGLNFENIYEPDVNMNPQSYMDVNTGSIQYLKTEAQPFTLPNYISRSKVDFISSVNPMNQEEIYYARDASLNDMKSITANQWMADSNYARENIMASQQQKNASRNMQFRMEGGRLSNANHCRYLPN